MVLSICGVQQRPDDARERVIATRPLLRERHGIAREADHGAIEPVEAASRLRRDEVVDLGLLTHDQRLDGRRDLGQHASQFLVAILVGLIEPFSHVLERIERTLLALLGRRELVLLGLLGGLLHLARCLALAPALGGLAQGLGPGGIALFERFGPVGELVERVLRTPSEFRLPLGDLLDLRALLSGQLVQRPASGAGFGLSCLLAELALLLDEAIEVSPREPLVLVSAEQADEAAKLITHALLRALGLVSIALLRLL